MLHFHLCEAQLYAPLGFGVAGQLPNEKKKYPEWCRYNQWAPRSPSRSLIKKILRWKSAHTTILYLLPSQFCCQFWSWLHINIRMANGPTNSCSFVLLQYSYLSILAAFNLKNHWFYPKEGLLIWWQRAMHW